MKKWKIQIWCSLILLPLFMQAQTEKSSNRIGIEFGGGCFFGETVAPSRVRAGQIVEGGDFFTALFAKQIVDVTYGGINFERFFLENQLGFAAGLRFSQTTSSVSGGYSYFFGIPVEDYFYWQFRQEDHYSDYLRIKRITQSNNFLGIPLGLRYFFKKKNSGINPYVKLGVAVNYLLLSTNSIVFMLDEMNGFAGEVEKQVDKPARFHSCIYPAYGITINTNNRRWFLNMEILFPSFLIGKKANPFIDPNYGWQVQFSVQIPLNKKTQ